MIQMIVVGRGDKMKVKWLPKEFKCSYCDKTKPTTECSNLISMGDWVCKPCFKVFGSDVLFVNGGE